MPRRSPPAPPVARARGFDVARIATGAAVVAVTWREAHRSELPEWEGRVFDLVNALPEGFRVLWPVMQLGSFAGIAVVAVATDRLTHDRRGAVRVATAGLAGYVAAKVIKRVVRRERPAQFRPLAVLREDARGHGYPSGHAAETAAMAAVLSRHLPRRAKWVPPLIAASVGFGRVYFGVHLPHDVLGGAALGTAVGGTINLAFDAFAPCD